jgi:hypothetical protein
MHDFKIVAVFDNDLTEPGSWNNFEVALYCNAQRIKSEAVHHLGNADASGHSPMFAVDTDCEAIVQTHR